MPPKTKNGSDKVEKDYKSMSQEEIEEMFKLAKIEDYENEEAKGKWKIENEETALWAGNKIARIVFNDNVRIDALLQQKEYWVKILEEKIATYDESIEKIRKNNEGKVNFFKYHLEKWLLQQKELDSKYTYSHPIIRTKFFTKPPQFKYDSDKMLKYLEDNKMDSYINKKVTTAIKVKEFENKIIEQDGEYVFEDTGEILDGVEKVIFDRTVKIEF